jgi:(1->4)-alpha-D-glucan 1-alpha-D-glucosylmutase
LASAPAGEVDSVETDRYRERLRGAMCKAAREARVRTSWVRPDRDYEEALSALVDAAFDVPGYVHRFRPFLERVAQKAAANSLVQLVLKHTVPGVPDTYQGTELWDLNLVDPDNRRPVDFVARASLLAQLEEQWDRDPAGVLARLSSQWRDGHLKLLLTRILLRTRAEHPGLFASGSYLPCDVGQADGKVCAFIRRNADVELLVVFARFPFARSDESEWLHWSLPDMARGNAWRDVLRRAPVSASVPALDEELPFAIWLRSAN